MNSFNLFKFRRRRNPKGQQSEDPRECVPRSENGRVDQSMGVDEEQRHVFSDCHESILQTTGSVATYVSQSLQAEEKSTEINSQLGSLFFGRIPLEIRLQIYRDTIAASQTFCLVCETEHVIVCQRKPGQEYAKHNYPLLPLLLMCRRGYIETIGIIYSTTTFHIPGLYNIRRFLSTIPTSQYQNLRSLQLTVRLGNPKFIKPDGAVQDRHRPDHPWRLHEIDWLNICRFLSTLKNLHTLRITFLRHYNCDLRMFQDFPPNNPDKIFAEALLEPLMSIHTTGNFDIEIHAWIYRMDTLFKGWLAKFEEREDTDKAPFVLRRFGETRNGDFGEENKTKVIRHWHAPQVGYDDSLQELYDREGWGDPDDPRVDVGSFRSDRWWEEKKD